MKDKKRFGIITGAGISIASGIPTFRCKNGLWAGEKAYAGESDRSRLATKVFFAKHPMASWERYHDFYRLMDGKKVNVGHRALTKFLEHCSESEGKTDALMLTQNVDGLHAADAKASPILSKGNDPRCKPDDNTRDYWTPFVYEMHGNGFYMHCSDETKDCSRKIFRAPSLKEFDEALEQAEEKEFVNEEGN